MHSMGDLGVKKSFTLTACDNSLEKYFLFLNFQQKNFFWKFLFKTENEEIGTTSFGFRFEF